MGSWRVVGDGGSGSDSSPTHGDQNSSCLHLSLPQRYHCLAIPSTLPIHLLKQLLAYHCLTQLVYLFMQPIFPRIFGHEASGYILHLFPTNTNFIDKQDLLSLLASLFLRNGFRKPNQLLPFYFFLFVSKMLPTSSTCQLSRSI